MYGLVLQSRGFRTAPFCLVVSRSLLWGANRVPSARSLNANAYSGRRAGHRLNRGESSSTGRIDHAGGGRGSVRTEAARRESGVGAAALDLRARKQQLEKHRDQCQNAAHFLIR
jgi:hypothetical protein